MSINLNHPISTEDVNTDMGLNTVPASGTGAPDEGWLLDRVHGVVFQGGTAPGIGDAQQGNVLDPAVGSFNFPWGLNGAVCNAGGTAANSVKIWCIFRETATTEEVTVSLTQNFQGRC